MSTRNWKRAGYTAGGVAAVMLTALTTLAFATDAESSPRFTVFAIVNLLAGILGITLVVSALLIECLDERIARFGEHLDEQGLRYVSGVKDTVDRLAEALPGSNVRRIS
ncbi:hypothetical protein ABGB07_44945 [Micromonosporaceae bacterium B7E4]